MADEAFWEGFARELSGWARRTGDQLAQVAEEKREEERQKKREVRQLINYEKMKGVDENYAIKEAERLMERQKEAAAFSQQLDQGMIEWKTEFGAKLGGALDDPELIKMREKAITSGDSVAQAYWDTVQKEIDRVQRGEIEFNPEIVEGLPFFARKNFNTLVLENTKRVQDYQLQKSESDRAIAMLGEQVTNYRSLQESRSSTDAKRDVDVGAGFDARIEKASKLFITGYTDFMTNLYEAGAIDDKGRARVGGLLEKNPYIVDPETGDFNPELMERIFKKKPGFRKKYGRITTLGEELAERQKEKKEWELGKTDNLPKITKEPGKESPKKWVDYKGRTFEVGKIYTLGGKKVRCVGINQFEEVK